MSFIQSVSNWLLGDYKVRTTKLSDNSLIQHVHLVDTDGNDVGGADGAIIDGASSAIKASVLDLTTANPLAVAITDGNGDQITSFGGGTQYTEGDTDASITGTAMLWEDAADTLRAVSAAKPLPIGDAGGSLTVDAPVGTPAFVRLSDGASAISTLPVSLASVPSHAVTNAGTFVVQENGAALTSLQLIDDAIATTASAITTKGMAISGTDGTNARVIKTDSSGELQVDVLTMPTTTVTATNLSTNIAQMNGVTVSMGAGATGTGVQRVVQANDSGKTLVSATGSASSSGNNTIVAAGSNKLKVYAFSLSMNSTSAVTVKFQSGAGGTDLWSVVLQAPTSVTTGANLCVTPPAYLFATGSATLLNLNLSAAVAVQWSVSYFDEA